MQATWWEGAGLMPDKLVIKGELLSASLAAVRATHDDFLSAKEESRLAAAACGHGSLAKALNDAASSWDVRRGRLVDTLDWLACAIEQSIQAFGDVDDRIAREVNPEAPAPPPPVLTSTGSEPSSAATQTAQQMPPQNPPAPPPAAPSSEPSQPRVAFERDEKGPADEADARVPDDSNGRDTGARRHEAPRPEHGHQPTGQESDAEGKKAAQLLSALWTRWTALGGTAESLLAAITGLGLVGLMAKGGGRRDAATVLPGQRSAPGVGSPATSAPSEGLPPEEGAGGSGGAPDSPEAMASATEADVAVPSAEEPAQVTVPPEAEVGVSTPVTDTMPPPMGGEPQTSLLAPTPGALASSKPAAGVEAALMPALQSDAPPGDGAHGSAPGSLPALGAAEAGSSTADEASSVLPPLAAETPRQPAWTPGLAVSGLAAGSGTRGTAPAGGPPSGELPQLRQERDPEVGASRPGGEHDARRILEDLREGHREGRP